MKVVYVVNNFDFFLSHRLELARHVMSLGHDVHVVGPKGLNEHKVSAMGFTTHTIPMKRTGINPIPELLAVFALYWKLRELRPDIVNSIALKAVTYTSLLSRFLSCPKFVCTITGLGHLFINEGFVSKSLRSILGMFFRIGLKHEKVRVIFQNQDDMNLFSTRGWVNKSRIRLIRGSGVDLKKFRVQPEPQGVCRILFAGRILKDKGIMELVGAAKLLKREGLNFELFIAGDIDPKNPSSVTKKELEIWQEEGVAEWIGPQSDMVAVYRDCHIVCLPSYREGLSLTLIEAAACARAILTTDVPGCRDVVIGENSGILVPAKNVDKLMMKMKALITNPMLRHKLGHAARKRAEEFFSKEIIIYETLKVYEISENFKQREKA